MDSRSAAYARKRRSDWIVALAMLVGGVLPSGLMDYAGYIEQWPERAVVAAAVVLFFVGAFCGGVLVTRGEVAHPGRSFDPPVQPLGHEASVTAAQIRAAAILVEKAALMDNEIVTLVELGSEGAMFYTGTFGARGPRILIARDGTYRGDTDAS